MNRRAATSTPTGERVVLDPAAEALAFVDADTPLQRLAVTEVTLREGELLVAVELATVCASDVHAVHGQGVITVPHVLGHEQVGRIVARGPGIAPHTVDGVPLALGDRIVWSVWVGCGDCPACALRRPDECTRVQRYGHERVRRGWELSGGLATHVHLLSGTAIARARDWVPAEVLAPASCATASVAARIDAAIDVEQRSLAGARVLVIGCDAAGLTAIAMARERGARVDAVDHDPGRHALAHAFGATTVLRPDRVPSGYDFTFAFPPGVARYRPEHLQEAVGFLERADHDLFARLVGETVSLDEVPRMVTTPAARDARIGVRP